MTKSNYLILFLFLALLFPLPASSQILKNVSEFKSKLTSLQRTGLSLYNNQVYIGEFISFVDDKSNLVSIDFKSFDKLMKQFLNEDKFNEFHKLFLDKSILSKEELNSFGIDLILDFTNFKLDIRTSELFLNPLSTSLNTYTVDQNEISHRSAPISGFVNYSLYDQYKTEDGVKNQNLITGTLNSNLNLVGLNLEDYENYANDTGLQRISTRLVKDFEEKNIRLSAGDQDYSPRLFQSSYQFLGLKLKKEFETTPYAIVNARGEGEIYLEVPSTIEIFINGLLIQTLSLEAGKHKIEDIPIVQGINHITLRISDASGNKRYVNLKQTGSESMLKPGVHDYEYNAGTISTVVNLKNKYTDKAVASFAHRYGVNTNWTTGFQGQYRNSFFNAGTENEIGTNRGLFVHNLTFSQAKNKIRGYSNRIAYFWSCPCGTNDQVKRFSIAYDFQSPTYLTDFFQGKLNSSLTRHILLASYSQKITDSISGLISSNLSFFDFNQLTKEQYILGLNKNINNNLFLSSNFQYQKFHDNKTKDDFSALIQLTFNFDNGKKNLVGTVNKNKTAMANQVEYTYNKNYAVNNTVYRARVQTLEDEKSASLAHYLNTEKFELSSGFDYSSSKNTKIFNVNPSGSIAFAGTGFSLGQRIQNTFVIVKNDLNEPLIINGDSENYESYLKPHSMNVLSSAQAYVPKTVNVISDDSKSDGLTNKGYKIQTTYKAGSLLTLGGEKVKNAEGFLFNDKDLPYSYAGGKLVNLSTGKELSFFTAKNGKFYLENLSPDTYQIIIYDKNTVKVFNLDLNHKLNDIHNDLGKIVIH